MNEPCLLFVVKLAKEKKAWDLRKEEPDKWKIG